MRVVAPLAGAWIEILTAQSPRLTEAVAPLAGAWIEICFQSHNGILIRSLPLREPGLK